MKKAPVFLTVFAAICIISLILFAVLGKVENETVSASETLSEYTENYSQAVSESDSSKAEYSGAESAEEKSSEGQSEESDKSESEEPSKEVSEEPSEEPSEESSKQAEVLTTHFLACPDNIIHPSVYYDAIEVAAKKAGVEAVYSPLADCTYDFSNIYSDVASHISEADVAYINVETLIGGNENPISGYPSFNSPEAAGEYLVTLGFDIMNVAHNHMLDSYDDKYLINCYNFFTDRGKTVIGYYKNKEAVNNIVVYESNGIKIALLAYTEYTNEIKLPSSCETYIPYFDEDLIKTQVALAKQVADVVIVSAHWGEEDSYTPNSSQKKWAKLFTSLDVDVVIGMHPHAIQEMCWMSSASGHKTLVAYSLGNFISGMLNANNMLGGMLDFDIVKDTGTGNVTIENVLFTPTVTHYTKPTSGLNSRDTGHRNYHIYYLTDYTEELASKHQVVQREKTKSTMLVGGGFSLENLKKTVLKYIPVEFLPSELTGVTESAYEKQVGIRYTTDISAYEEYMDPDEDYLLLVNLSNPLSEDYVPEGLVVSEFTRNDGRDGQKLLPVVEKALKAMMLEAKANGVTGCTITSAYRSAKYQRQLFNYYTEQKMAKDPTLTREEAEALTLKTSMKPGCSEHQTGLCFDMHNLDSASQKFGSTAEGKWFAENCWRFGFIIRYPADKEDITGVSYEPWHFRFVGRTASTEMHELNMCLEEYVQYKSNN